MFERKDNVDQRRGTRRNGGSAAGRRPIRRAMGLLKIVLVIIAVFLLLLPLRVFRRPRR